MTTRTYFSENAKARVIVNLTAGQWSAELRFLLPGDGHVTGIRSEGTDWEVVLGEIMVRGQERAGFGSYSDAVAAAVSAADDGIEAGDFIAELSGGICADCNAPAAGKLCAICEGDRASLCS